MRRDAMHRRWELFINGCVERSRVQTQERKRSYTGTQEVKSMATFRNWYKFNILAEQYGSRTVRGWRGRHCMRVDGYWHRRCNYGRRQEIGTSPDLIG